MAKYQIIDKYGVDLLKIKFKDWHQLASSLCQKTVFSYQQVMEYEGDLAGLNGLIINTGLEVVEA